MFIEIHAIQNFAPSNLNRDDTGSPKDCEFGGHRRARISSQCWKRAVREHFKSEELLAENQRGVRTKRLVETLQERLVGALPEESAETALTVASNAVAALGFGIGEDAKTSVLLFLGNDQIDRLVEVCVEHRTALALAPQQATEKGEKGKKQKKKESALPAKLTKTLQNSLNASRAVDLALFGRMIAEAPAQNVNAACQVAHAISTHRVSQEFDYFTAVDDLGKEDETGAGMLGTQEFNSACFYRYANISMVQLKDNLGDSELAVAGVRAFLQSFIMAIPKAKQNGTAAQSLPAFVMVVVRDKGLWSLANAFVKTVDMRGEGLIENSIERLARHWADISAMYGDGAIRYAGVASMSDAPLGTLSDNRVPNLNGLIDRAIEELRGTL